MSKPETAALFGVGRATVYHYLKLDKQGELVPKPHPGQAWRLDMKGCELLLGQVEENADLTLEEHIERAKPGPLGLVRQETCRAQNQPLKVEYRHLRLGQNGTRKGPVRFVRLGVRRKKDALSQGA